MSCKISADARCAVIGHGSWATALVSVLAQQGRPTLWYIRNEEVLASVASEGVNPKYLSDVRFDTSVVELSGDLDAAVSAADIVVLAMPSAFLETFLAPLTVPLTDKFVVSAVKGIIPDGYQTVVGYLEQRYALDASQLAVITGPSHAEEVSRGGLTYLTVACADREAAAAAAARFATPSLRVSCSDDLYGVEYATVLKNIYALAVGMAVGLNYGDNFLAVLIANCTREMERFLREATPGERDLHQAAYLGDLLVTCYSSYSRNRRLGLLIGHGCTVRSALNEMTMVAEGYYGADCIRHIGCRHEIEMPVADMVYEVLYRNGSPRRLMKALTAKLQ